MFNYSNSKKVQMLVNLQQLLDLHNIRENKLTKQKRIRAQKKTWSDSQHKFEIESLNTAKKITWSDSQHKFEIKSLTQQRI